MADPGIFYGRPELGRQSLRRKRFDRFDCKITDLLHCKPALAQNLHRLRLKSIARPGAVQRAAAMG